MIDQERPAMAVARPTLTHPRLWPLPNRPVAAVVVLVAAVVVVASVAVVRQGATPAAALPPASAPSSKLTARGAVRPIAQARVGTLTGGVLDRLVVDAGDAVNDQQEIARVRTPNGTEIVSAPFRGTVTTVIARFGDTLVPGAVIATVGDLSRLQIETTDVDEFLIAHVHRAQSVTIRVEALDRELSGRVRSVSLEPVTTLAGDEHYPVTIDLVDAPPDLRPGMTARLTFSE